MGTLALRTSRRNSLRPSGAMVTLRESMCLLLAHRALIRRRHRPSPKRERLVSLLRSPARDFRCSQRYRYQLTSRRRKTTAVPTMTTASSTAQ